MYNIRGELRVDGALAHGWCWSPQKVRERLRVELLLDGALIGASVASRLRLDLAQDGLCDGYHGFSMPLPLSDDAYNVLEAREAETGQIFGRCVGKQADAFGWLARTEALQRQCDAWHETFAHHSRDLGVSLLGAGLAGLGRVLSSVPRALRPLPGLPLSLLPLSLLRVSLPRVSLPRDFRLPVIDNPRVSLVIDAAPDSEAALTMVVTLAPLLRSYAVELVVVDHGRGSASAGLATVVGLSYILLRVDDLAMRLNCAAQCARGAFVVMFDPCVCTLRDITALLERCVVSRWALLRHAMVAAADHVALRALQTAGLARAAASFVAIAVPNGTFHSVGGFAPNLHTDVGGGALDFARRAVTEGHRVQTLGNVREGVIWHATESSVAS